MLFYDIRNINLNVDCIIADFGASQVALLAALVVTHKCHHRTFILTSSLTRRLEPRILLSDEPAMLVNQ